MKTIFNIIGLGLSDGGTAVLTSFVITFRELLEASLVVVIVLSYLKRAGQGGYGIYVWYGASAGIIASVSLAIAFSAFLGGLDGNTEKVFEGITMALAAVLLTWMIVWMMGQRQVIKKLETKVHNEIGSRGALGISLLVATAVLREGVETVIFLQSASFEGGANLSGAVAGAGFAIIIASVVFTGVKKVNLKLFFQSSSALLILFAAGLTSHALLEFQEAGIISPITGPLYDITWLIDKKSLGGGILKSLFGYTGRPSLTEMMGYGGYFILTYLLYRHVHKIQTSPLADRS